MLRWRVMLFVAMGILAGAAPVLGQGVDDAPPQHLLDRFPWLGDFLATILGVGMLCLLVYLLRPGSPLTADFSIHVDGEEVSFKGRFPAGAEALVRDFLVHDCRIDGAYVVSGKWQGERLAISVQGDEAKALEQRIRNFLKLNVKHV